MNRYLNALLRIEDNLPLRRETSALALNPAELPMISLTAPEIA